MKQVFVYTSIMLFSSFMANVNATTLYVNYTATGLNTGETWQNAFSSLSEALIAAATGDSVWVAAGQYLPSGNLGRNNSFILKNGVKLYGGFIGTETSILQRNWTANQTILSGDIGILGDSTDNAYTILYMEQVDASTQVDGIYFLYGNADDPNGGYDQPSTCGGAIYINGKDGIAYPKIHNCVFMHNHSLFSGGAVYVNGSGLGSVAPQFNNCHFELNHADYDGGAISRYGGSWDGVANDFWDCKFIKNIAGHHGGGIHYFETERLDTIEFVGCEFVENEANNIGGAVGYLGGRETGTKLVIEDCKFDNNRGDGFRYIASNFLYMDLLTVRNCHFHKNDFFADEFSLDFATSKYLFGNNYFFKGGLNFGASLDTVEIQNSVFDQSRLWCSSNLNQINIEICSFENISTASYIAGAKSVKVSNCIFQEIDTIFTRKQNGFRTNIVISNSNFVNVYDKLYQETNPNSPLNHRYSYKIYNSVFKGNGEYVLPFEADSFYIENSIIDTAGCENLTPRTITCGPGMLYNLDPLFLDTAAHDYRLSPCSPARNAGSNAIVDSLGILTDITGAPRIQGGTVDMGAYESPAFQATTATVLSPACGTGGLASLSLDLEHGCPPFFLDWGQGTQVADTTPAIISLPVGAYSITVTDGRMESDTIALQINAAPVPTASLGATPVQCPSGAGQSVGGIATIEATGGTAPFSYLWSSGDSTANATGLAVATYTVTLTDANGCTLTDSVIVGTAGSLTLGINIHPISCAGDSDGSATVQPLGGTMPFAWQWQNGQTSPTLDSLSGGSFAATVTDALGCTGDIDFTMTPLTAVSVSINAMNPLCFGGLATATASASGGTGSFQYAWSNGATTASTMLPAGQHTVTATDAHGCTGTDTVSITSPPALTVNVTPEPPTLCHGDSNGVLNVTANGGTPPYGWGGPLENLPAGNYVVTITDSNACTAIGQATIAEYPEITVADTVADASNPTAADGGIMLTSVLGGTGSGYTFLWSNGAASQNLTNVPTGDYTVTVTDSQGCTGSFTFFVDFNSAADEAGTNPFGAAIVPNPSGKAGAMLLLERPLANLTVRIFDAQGRLVFAEQTSATDYQLPKGLAAGTYQVVLEWESKRAALKWVVGE